ncbi:MAG: transcriptional regulator NrdR [Anaerolineae bacterium]|nr:transcriptional regulator NrdR [Anaerolineae bacterium]
MKCPYCSSGDSKVIDTREARGRIRRRRECINCQQRFTTYEMVVTLPLAVIKRDRQHQPFESEKLVTGIRKACAKRPVSKEEVEGLAEEVERELYEIGQPEVESALIGKLVLERLRELDDVAYLRFASVHRRFPDVDTLAEEIEDYREWKRREEELEAQLRLSL